MIKSMTPFITEERELNVAQMDVFSRLMMDRIIFIGQPIDSDLANIVQAQLLFLESTSDKDITIYINSPGGEVYAGLGIYDTMQLIRPDVNTVCTGLAASMAAVLLCAGKKRSCLKHSNIMLHQVSGGSYGTFSDMSIEVQHMQRLQNNVYGVIQTHTNLSIEQVNKICDRDFWMDPNKALEMNVIDEILTNR